MNVMPHEDSATKSPGVQPAPPRCDECGQPIREGVAPIWDVLLSAMFCSTQCHWRYRDTGSADVRRQDRR